MPIKAVTRSLEQSVSTGILNEEAINEYIDKMYPPDAAQSERLNEELVKLYNTHTQDSIPPPVLIRGLTRLGSFLAQPEILESWFGSLVPYAVDSSGVSSDLVEACTEFITSAFRLEVAEVSQKYIGWLLEIYFKKDMGGWISSPNITMERRRFIRFNCRMILLEVFPKTVESIAEQINGYVLQKEYRLISLQLLSECVSKCDQSKLFKINDLEMLQTLYKILEFDQSSACLSIAEKTLAMILPHICDKLVPSLGRIYSCFGRLCSWDSVEAEPASPPGWEVLASTEEDEAPSTESLYMIIYGLFPNNTLAFCRDPDGYLSRAGHERPFSDFWSASAIKHNAQQLFGVFLLHPGLLTSSAEQEVETNSTRWQSYRSTVDIIMQCVGLHAASVGHQHESDDDQLNALLAEHMRLFRSNMAGSSISAATRSRSSSRPSRASRSPSVPRSPSIPRHSLLSSPNPSEAPSEVEEEEQRRRRSKSQPPQPSDMGSLSSLTMMAPPTTGISTVNSPALGPALGPTSTGITSVPTEASEYFFRELLLSKNELDFSNFHRYILERRLVKIQKRMAMLEMGNIRVENLVQKNKQLATRVNLLDQELAKSQRGARTLLTQRTSYESNILDKNKRLKQQLRDQESLTLEQEQEVSRLRHQMQEQQSLTDRRGMLVSELELSVTRLQSKLEQLTLERQQEDESIKAELDDDIDEGVQEGLARAERESHEAKLQKLLLECEGATHDYEQRLSALEKDKRRLQQVVQEQQRKLEGSTVLAQKHDTTRRKVVEIQARAAQQYDALKQAHDELLKRYSVCERELRARRVHDEERLNDLRSTLVTMQPLQSEESRLELKMRDGRGGAQKR